MIGQNFSNGRSLVHLPCNDSSLLAASLKSRHTYATASDSNLAGLNLTNEQTEVLYSITLVVGYRQHPFLDSCRVGHDMHGLIAVKESLSIRTPNFLGMDQ